MSKVKGNDSTIYVFLDSDESKFAEIKNIDSISSLEELMQICKTKLRLPNMDESQYGFKTKFEAALLQDITDITKKATTANRAEFMAEKSHLDGNLTTNNLICRNLLDEAVEA